MDIIINPKSVDGKAVLQLEIAAGAAIQYFQVLLRPFNNHPSLSSFSSFSKQKKKKKSNIAYASHKFT
jgi:hypothetical protein